MNAWVPHKLAPQDRVGITIDELVSQLKTEDTILNVIPSPNILFKIM